MIRQRSFAALVCLALPAVVSSQAPGHIVLSPMANMSRPGALDFQGGSCDIDGAGDRMTCAFQQVVLTPAQGDPTTCLIVTNRYSETFKKQDARRWVSNSGPEGICGVVTVTTLEQRDGGSPTYWNVTLNTRKIVTNKNAAPSCAVQDDAPETLASTNARRELSCRSVSGSGIE